MCQSKLTLIQLTLRARHVQNLDFFAAEIVDYSFDKSNPCENHDKALCRYMSIFFDNRLQLLES